MSEKRARRARGRLPGPPAPAAFLANEIPLRAAGVRVDTGVRPASQEFAGLSGEIDLMFYRGSIDMRGC